MSGGFQSLVFNHLSFYLLTAAAVTSVCLTRNCSSSPLSLSYQFSFLFFFFKIFFIYLTEKETASERGNTSRDSGRGTWCGARSHNAGITPWAKGRRLTTEPPRRPSILFSCCTYHLYAFLVPQISHSPAKHIISPLSSSTFFLKMALSFSWLHRDDSRSSLTFPSSSLTTVSLEFDLHLFPCPLYREHTSLPVLPDTFLQRFA